MQVLTLQKQLPVYLPYDLAPVPFGDPFTGINTDTATSSTFTVPGYQPTNGDAVQVFQGAGGALAASFTAGQVYYVVGAAANSSSFNLATTVGGTGLIGSTRSTGLNVNVLKAAAANALGPALPFKPNWSVVALNTTSTSVTLLGAADSGQNLPGAGPFNPPAGPGTYAVLATVAAGAAQVVQLTADWIMASAFGTTAAASLILLQN